MTQLFRNFADDDSGAVTVDWVVLTASLVALGIAMMSMVITPVSNVSSDISDDMVTTINARDAGATRGAYTD